MTQVKEKKKKSPFIKPRDKMLQQKGKKEIKVKARKRKRSPYSSSSFSSFSTESENEIVVKRFKIIPKGEELKRNLPSSKADYANLHFESYIPDKSISEKILTENPVPSNLQEVSILDDFVKTLLVSQTAISTDWRMEKFQEKIFYRLWVLYHDWKYLQTHLLHWLNKPHFYWAKHRYQSHIHIA